MQILDKIQRIKDYFNETDPEKFYAWVSEDLGPAGVENWKETLEGYTNEGVPAEVAAKLTMKDFKKGLAGALSDVIDSISKGGIPIKFEASPEQLKQILTEEDPSKFFAHVIQTMGDNGVKAWNETVENAKKRGANDEQAARHAMKIGKSALLKAITGVDTSHADEIHVIVADDKRFRGGPPKPPNNWVN